ncbi:GntR family transcriptional regulator [Lacisediminihabitans profunda]|uniref:GntR family transcriptional regulator n=1 Tax=Lacisediminihabitans profunda TaxID=2594790 RepID=A0A5C8URK6_9MICO|nr:GntR family transcriptional regulator [Lacisediminihabitans profunda]
MRQEILDLIAERGLDAGDKLDAESALSKRFGVSRPTVREALKSLEQEGVLNAVQGQGRFISSMGSLAVERPITRYESITEVLTALGYEIVTAVLGVAEGEATAVEAKALRLEEGAPVIRLARIRYGNDEPLVVNLNTIVRDALPGSPAHRDWSASLTSALEAHGHHITSSVARITATELPPEFVQRHALSDLGPWLLVQETCLTTSGRRVLYAEDYHRGDAIAFNVLRHR